MIPRVKRVLRACRHLETRKSGRRVARTRRVVRRRTVCSKDETMDLDQQQGKDEGYVRFSNAGVFFGERWLHSGERCVFSGQINSTLIDVGEPGMRQLIREVDRKKVSNKNGNAASNTRMIPAIIHARLPLLSSLYSIQRGS